MPRFDGMGGANRLRVIRETRPTGWLWARRASYSVYAELPDGTLQEVVAGRFRDAAEARRRAEQILAERARDATPAQ